MGTFEFICPSCKKHNINYENYYDEFEDEFTHKCKHCNIELKSFYKTGWKTKINKTMKTTCGILLICDDKILIGRVTGFKNMWSIPKGLIDPGETIKDAAIRELKEETDIAVELITILDEEPFFVNYSHNKKRLCVYVATTETQHDAICNSFVIKKGKEPFPEIDMFMWVDYNEAMQRLHVTQQEALLYFLNVPNLFNKLKLH